MLGLGHFENLLSIYQLLRLQHGCDCVSAILLNIMNLNLMRARTNNQWCALITYGNDVLTCFITVTFTTTTESVTTTTAASTVTSSVATSAATTSTAATTGNNCQLWIALFLNSHFSKFQCNIVVCFRTLLCYYRIDVLVMEIAKHHNESRLCLPSEM